MVKVECPDCKCEKGNYEIVNVVAAERRYQYEVRCPDCGKTFVVYGKDTKDAEGKPSGSPFV